MTAALYEAGIVLRLRARLLTRLLLPSFTLEAKRAAPYRLGGLVLIGGVLLLGFGLVLAHALLSAFHGHSLRPFLLPALAWGPTAATTGIFFYATVSLSAVFTHRSDLSLLMLAPVSPRLVLADKLLAICAGFSALMLFVGVPDLIGVGGALHAGTWFTIIGLLVVLMLPVPAASLALLLGVIVLHRLPPSKARVGTAAIGTVAAITLYTLVQTFGSLTVAMPWGAVEVIPQAWPGGALVAAANNNLGQAAGYLIAFLVVSAGLAWLAIDRAATLLTTGWTVYGEIGRRPARTRSGSLTRGRAGTFAPRGPAWWPLVRKEWLSLRRDPKLLAQMAYPLLLEGYSFYHAFGNPFTAHALTGRLARIFGASLYLTSSLTALFLLSVLALPIVSREGRSLYLLGLLPVRPINLLLAKVLFCLVPVLIPIEALLVTIAVRILTLSPAQTLYAGAVLAALVGALSCWMVCVGLLWPRLTSDGSRRQVHGTALLVGPISGGALCVVIGLLLEISVGARHTAAVVPAIAGVAIFVITGTILLGVFMVGPRIMSNLLTGDRRPA